MHGLEGGPFQRGTVGVGGAAEIAGGTGGSRRIGVITNKVANFIAIGRHAGARARRLPQQPQFGAAALFRLQAAHPVIGKVQVVEGGCPKARTHLRTQLQLLRQRLGGTEAAGRVVAIGRIVVVPHTGLHVGARTELAGIPRQQPLVVTAAMIGLRSLTVHARGGIAGRRHLLVQVFPAQHQLLAGLQLQCVLPGQLPARRPVAVRAGRTTFCIVFGGPELGRCGPAVGHPAAIIQRRRTRGQAVPEILQGIALAGSGIPSGAVVLRIQLRLRGHQAHPVPGHRGQPQVHRTHRTPKTVPVRVVVTIGIVRTQGRFTPVLLAPHAHCIIELPQPRGGSTADIRPRLSSAIASHGQMGGQFRCPLPAAGDEVDHPAHGIRPVQPGGRSAHHLDAFELRQIHGAELGLPQRGRAHAHAIHQHHHPAGPHAAQKVARALPRAAIACQLQTRVPLQRILHRMQPAGMQPVTVDQHHIAHAVGQWLCLAGGRHHHGTHGCRMRLTCLPARLAVRPPVQRPTCRVARPDFRRNRRQRSLTGRYGRIGRRLRCHRPQRPRHSQCNRADPGHPVCGRPKPVLLHLCAKRQPFRLPLTCPLHTHHLHASHEPSTPCTAQTMILPIVKVFFITGTCG